MRRFMLLITALALLLLPSCAPSDNFSAGRPISKEELESLSAELLTAADGSGETPPKYTDREPNTVYWTESGSVYHKYRDCYHLQNAEAVQSGTVLTAQMNGKERVCAECGDE